SSWAWRGHGTPRPFFLALRLQAAENDRPTPVAQIPLDERPSLGPGIGVNRLPLFADNLFQPTVARGQAAGAVCPGFGDAEVLSGRFSTRSTEPRFTSLSLLPRRLQPPPQVGLGQEVRLGRAQADLAGGVRLGEHAFDGTRLPG